MAIIGITGTFGAGKGTVVEYLVQSRGFIHLSVRKFLEEILKKKGRPTDRDQMHTLANDLRGQFGGDYIARALYDEALHQHQSVVIESIRAVGEVETLKRKENFILLGVDAPIEVRYDRITMRGERTDFVTFDKFVQQEQAEMDAKDDAHQNLRGCINKADYVIENTGSKEDLIKKIEEFLARIHA